MIQKKARMSVVIPLFKIVLKVLTSAIQLEKEMKGIQTRKKLRKIKLSLFAYNMSTYIENHTSSTKNATTTNKFGKVAGYNLQDKLARSIGKNQFYDTSNQLNEIEIFLNITYNNIKN